MSSAVPNAAKFRTLLASRKMIVAPGAIDCITGRAIAQAGFSAVYMTGAGTSATLGYPDYGLITMSEMVGNASRISKSIDIPLISDSDTGFGNELNVFRTVQEFESAGVAAIHIEDQVFPKKCGHLDNKELVSREDFVAKIRAASAARRSKDFCIIARTDSRAVVGLEEAIERANLALANGADVAFVEAPQTMAEIEAVPKLVKGPCLLNVVRGGKTPEIELEVAERMGYAIAIVPGLLLGALGYGLGLLLWGRWGWRRPAAVLAISLVLQSLILMGAGLLVFENWLVVWFGGLLVFSLALPLALSALQTRWQQLVAPDPLPQVLAQRYRLEWAARLLAFVCSAVLADAVLAPLLAWKHWPAWLVGSLGQGPGRPLAVSLGAMGWVLLLALLLQRRMRMRT